MLDRRQFERFENLPIEVFIKRTESDDFVKVDPMDIGVGGVRIRTTENILMYEPVMIKILLHQNVEDPMTLVNAKAWRIEPDTVRNDDLSRYVALCFIDLEDKYRKNLVDFVTDYIINSSITKKK